MLPGIVTGCPISRYAEGISGLPGPKGNREFFLQLVQRQHPSLPDDLEEWIADATA